MRGVVAGAFSAHDIITYVCHSDSLTNDTANQNIPSLSSFQPDRGSVCRQHLPGADAIQVLEGFRVPTRRFVQGGQPVAHMQHLLGHVALFLEEGAVEETHPPYPSLPQGGFQSSVTQKQGCIVCVCVCFCVCLCVCV